MLGWPHEHCLRRLDIFYRQRPLMTRRMHKAERDRFAERETSISMDFRCLCRLTTKAETKSALAWNINLILLRLETSRLCFANIWIMIHFVS